MVSGIVCSNTCCDPQSTSVGELVFSKLFSTCQLMRENFFVMFYTSFCHILGAFGKLALQQVYDFQEMASKVT
jgi:hypothetical protein